MWKFIVKCKGEVTEYKTTEKSKKKAFAWFRNNVDLPDAIHTVRMVKEV